MVPLLEEALRRAGEGRRCAFVTIISVAGSAPQVPGAKMLVVDMGGRDLSFGTIGGGALEHAAQSEALQILRSSGAPCVFHKDLAGDLGMACGGRVSYFVEPVAVAPQLVICGGGHIGRALARVASELDFSVTVVDPLPEYANAERFPGAARIINSFDEATIERELAPSQDFYIVIATRDHPTDFRLARFFLRREWKYLGVIASRTKAAALRRELQAEGFDPARIARLTAPIGLPIGGASPAEIAVGVAAEIVQVRNALSGAAPRAATAET